MQCQVTVKCFKRNNLGYSFFLISPTKEYHAVSLIFTQRFSVGHFWSPYHTTNEGIFCKLFINTENPISYKHSASIGSKTLIFIQLVLFQSIHTTIPRPRPWVLQRQLRKSRLLFFVTSPNLIKFRNVKHLE